MSFIPPLHTLPFREVLAYSLGFMAPMVVMWFVGPLVANFAESRGLPSGEWEARWFLFIPYPYPFTLRAALAVALIVVPPAVFMSLWYLSCRRHERRQTP